MEDIGPLAEKVTTVFVTADPGRDTAEVLDKYVARPSIGTRWSGSRSAALKDVETPFQASTSTGPTKPDGSYDVSHTAFVYAIDLTGKVQVEGPSGRRPTRSPTI